MSESGEGKIQDLTGFTESLLIPRDQLPPFSCGMDSLGVPEVLVGSDAPDGGRWAIKDGAAEEEVRRLLQEAVDSILIETEETDECGSLDEFEWRVHFLISHAIQMGWYIRAPRHVVSNPGQVEKNFAVSNSNVPDRISKFECLECGSNEISVIRVWEVMTKRYARLVDGRITTGNVVETRNGDTTSIRFECLVCREQWEVPAWIEQLIDEDSDGFRSDDGDSPDEPIPFIPLTRIPLTRITFPLIPPKTGDPDAQNGKQ